jgi:hypothetical protein
MERKKMCLFVCKNLVFGDMRVKVAQELYTTGVAGGDGAYTLKTLWLNTTRNWVNNPPNTFLVKLTHFLVQNYRLNKNLVYIFGLLTRKMVNFFNQTCVGGFLTPSWLN